MPLVENLPELSTTARTLLDQFVEAFVELGFDDIPEERFVSPGADLAWDGEQLSVNFLTIDQGVPGAAFGGTYPARATLFFAHFSVMLLREVPVPSDGGGGMPASLPSPQEAEQAALRTINDAGYMAEAAVRVHAKHKVNEAGMGFAIGPVSSFGPAGGLVGNRCQVQISLA